MTNWKDSEIFPTEVSDLDRALIHSWYDMRVVCDDNNFPRFFRRELAKDYPIYLQMVRIQPGVDGGAAYDWLVQNYAASINQVNGTTSGTEQNNSTSSTTGTTTNNSAENSHAEGKTDGTSNSTKNTTDTPGVVRTDTTTKAGSETHKQNGTNTDTITLNHATTLAGDEVHDRGANGIVDTKEIKGSYIDHTHHNTIDKTTSDQTTTTSGHNDKKDASKVAPMSISGAVSNVAAGADQVDSMNLDFAGSASNIAQSNTHDHQTVKVTGGPSVGHTGNDATEHRYGMHLDADGNTVQDPGDVYTETNTQKGQETIRYVGREDKVTGTDTTTHNLDSSDTTTYTDRKDTVTHEVTGSDTGEETTEGTTTGTSSNTGSRTTEGSGSSTTDETASGSTTKSGMSETTGKAESNGRHEAPADILMRAMSFIEQCNAADWLISKLNVCFYGQYEI